MKKLKILCFGNEFVQGDTLAKEIANVEIEGVEFIKCDVPDALLGIDNPVILDVVKDILEPVLIIDPNQLKSRKISTLHDFDLGFYIKLLATVDPNMKITVIGIPQKGNKKNIIEKIKKLIETIQ